MGEDGYIFSFSVPVVIDDSWSPMVTIRLPDHVAVELNVGEIESALFSEYVRVNGDAAFDH